mmetsp:Transcript_73125/g.126972  ORF Transcript_73125/g.126972 Transcript_73125/m.126972 type:complete len:258 (-) Transcript_73125:230-1003(-)
MRLKMSHCTNWRFRSTDSKRSSHSVLVTITCPPDMSHTRHGEPCRNCVCSTVDMSNFPWWMLASLVSELKAPGEDTKKLAFLFFRSKRRPDFLATLLMLCSDVESRLVTLALLLCSLNKPSDSVFPESSSRLSSTTVVGRIKLPDNSRSEAPKPGELPRLCMPPKLLTPGRPPWPKPVAAPPKPLIAPRVGLESSAPCLPFWTHLPFTSSLLDRCAGGPSVSGTAAGTPRSRLGVSGQWAGGGGTRAVLPWFGWPEP